MPLYDDLEEPEFAELLERYAWVPNALAVEYGEWGADETLPEALNWLNLLPEDPRYDLDEVECSLAYVNPATGYTATVWDASGENDLPWVVLLADDYGVRILEEYSLMDEDAGEDDLDAMLARATEELPTRLHSGEFDRTGEPLAVPEWLLTEPEEAE